MPHNSWEEHRLNVTESLSRLEAQNTAALIQNMAILDQLSELKTDLAIHKVKSGFFGAMAGAVVALGAWVMERAG